MRVRKIFRIVGPYISALAVIATAAILVFAIYFTELSLQWITFLAGILVAAILAEATRVSKAEWTVMRRTAQLATVKDKLDRETKLRKRFEELVSASKSKLHLIDEILPTMIAFVDLEGRCQYHNRAFMEMLRLRPEQIHGRQLREILGAKIYQEVATAVRQSLDGHTVHYEQTIKMHDSAVYRLLVEHLPQFGDDGKVNGFYMLMNDYTSPANVQTSNRIESKEPLYVGKDVQTTVHDDKNNQEMFVDSFAEQISGQKDASRIIGAIEKGDFRLFCQLITPLALDSAEAEHYEILVRLAEEEEGMMPPGAFFPLAEKYGQMLHLDRWVVRHVAEWISRHHSADEKRKDSIFFINVSSATIADPSFPHFLQLMLQEQKVPGAALCFEIPDSELAVRTLLVAEFARKIKQCGCRVAISGFGRDRVLFDLFRGFQIDFLKIDGSIVFNILRDPVVLAKIMAISSVAKKIGVQTIAELVESEETIAKLREIGIDFAQGFGISRPRDLAE